MGHRVPMSCTAARLASVPPATGGTSLSRQAASSTYDDARNGSSRYPPAGSTRRTWPRPLCTEMGSAHVTVPPRQDGCATFVQSLVRGHRHNSENTKELVPSVYARRNCNAIRPWGRRSRWLIGPRKRLVLLVRKAPAYTVIRPGMGHPRTSCRGTPCFPPPSPGRCAAPRLPPVVRLRARSSTAGTKPAPPAHVCCRRRG